MKKYAIVKKEHAENNQKLLNASVSTSFDQVLKSSDENYFIFSFEDIDVEASEVFSEYPIVNEDVIIKIIEEDTFSDYANYKATPRDSDNVHLSRTKVAPTGWHYQLMSFEVVTSKKDSLFCKDAEDTDLGLVSVKFYNSEDEDISNEDQSVLDTDCVKTVVDFEATFDIEIFGGILHHEGSPASDVRVWIVAAPEIPVELGGKVHFFNGGLNLKYITSAEAVKTDGKVPKKIKYDPDYHSGALRLIIKHPAGLKHGLQLGFEYYKE